MNVAGIWQKGLEATLSLVGASILRIADFTSEEYELSYSYRMLKIIYPTRTSTTSPF